MNAAPPDILSRPQVPLVPPEFLEGDKIQPGHPLFGLIWINPARVSGAPCFFGTRVPVRALFDSLSAGETFDEFFDGYEGVTEAQVRGVLALAGSNLLRVLDAA